MVFVYGSLKRDHFNFSVLREGEGEFVKEVTIPGFCLVKLCVSYPTALQDDSGREVIYAEAFLVSNGLLEKLDRLEGHPRSEIFQRRRVTTDLGLEGWMYCCTDHGKKEVTALPFWRDRVVPEGRW